MRPILLLTMLLCFSSPAKAQVKTDFNNAEAITTQGKFMKGFRAKSPYVIPARDSKALLEKETLENKPGEAKPFRIAEAVAVDIDVAKEAAWVEDGEYAHGKFTLVAAGAKSVSANFDRFSLPKGTELYVYSENGEMVTGPVTENENNANGFWGTWVYKGGMLTVEFKTPVASRATLELHISSVAYGYKDIYKTEVGGFEQSSPCNINVLCPLGNGWENERNSVALILDANSERLCSGALVNNTCNLDIPYLLTANHCFDTPIQQNVANWKFTFQAWSATCNPSQNANGITFNGSTLRARNAGSDFCLVEMNQMPAANSGITLAGWSRNTAGIQQTTIIHHPAGDVMKISRDDQAPVFAGFLGAQTWQLGLDQGATNGVSSGAPYFDQNRRIIAQHFGTNNINADPCLNTIKFGGRFDISWTGGGTNATRLSNWLDPNNAGALTTNTRGVGILGPSLICASANSTYTLVGALTWSATPASLFTATSGTGATFSTSAASGVNGSGTITATTASACGSVTINVGVSSALPTPTISIVPLNSGAPSNCVIRGNNYRFDAGMHPNVNLDGGYEWIIPSGWTYRTGQGSRFLDLGLPVSGSYSPVVQVRLKNACTTGSYAVRQVNTCGGGFSLQAWPNPADGQFSVAATAATDTEKTGPTVDAPVADEYVLTVESDIRLMDAYSQTLWQGRMKKGRVTVPTAKIRDGLYYLIIEGEQPVSKQIMIRH